MTRLQLIMISSGLRRRGHAVVTCTGRSSASATLAYSLALTLNLHQPEWAPVSALITAKDSVGDTFAECRSRIVGTAIGILGQCLLSRLDLSLVAQLAIIIAATAVVVSHRPEWRVGLWTAAVTLLSQLPDVGIWETGLARFCEVAIGSIVATGVATLDPGAWRRWLWKRWLRRRHSPKPPPAGAPD